MADRYRSTLLEVQASMPAGLSYCRHRERVLALAGVGAAVRQQAEGDDAPQLPAEAGRLAAWLRDLARRCGERLQSGLPDARPRRGPGRARDHGVRRDPGWIVSRRHRPVGGDAAPHGQAPEKETVSGSPGEGSGPGRLGWSRIRAWLRRMARGAGDILYGMTVFDWVRDLRRERGAVEHLFVLITFGDLVGVPILPPYYTLRLLPYAIPCIQGWKRCLLRERDLTDLTEFIEGID